MGVERHSRGDGFLDEERPVAFLGQHGAKEVVVMIDLLQDEDVAVPLEYLFQNLPPVCTRRRRRQINVALRRAH